MVQRFTYRRHNRYNTRSNKTRVVKIPGGTSILQNLKKKASRVKCADCKEPLHGIPALRAHEFHSAPKKDRSVSRVYGGSRCHRCLRSRIVRAFLLEEQRCVKLVLAELGRQAAQPKKKTATKEKEKTAKKTKTSKK